MDHKEFKKREGPEAVIQKNFIKYLKQRGWNVERVVGNLLQSGFPDIYIMHPQHGQRWVDLKNPKGYEFTSAQKWKWPIWEAHGVGIWIIAGWTDEEYDKLFRPPNWREYWKSKYDEERLELAATIQELFDEFQAMANISGS
jgi:hypothetical protein